MGYYFLMSLNEEQTRAVQHRLDHPACLIAGAGSGKTRVLTERIRYLIEQRQVPQSRILALTFTNRAADEMKSRLAVADRSVLQPQISTIHSMALSLVREAPTLFGLRRGFTILEEYQQKKLLEHIIEEKGYGEHLEAWKLGEAIEFHRARGIGFSSEYTPEYHEEYGQWEHGGYHSFDEDGLEVWEAFEKQKATNNVVDFSDMILLTVRKGNTDSAWLANIASRFDHVLMDEAQDTNIPQWELVQMFLAPGNLNFYAVGDLSQSIYGFNGAVPRLLKEFSEGWRGAVPDLYKIERNHRSVPEIVRLANAIQRKMTETIPIQMQSFREIAGEKGLAKLTQAMLPSDIAAAVASEIYTGAHRTTPPIPFKDNAILVRSATQIRDIEGELLKYRIPYVVLGGTGLLGTEEVRDVLAFLKVAANPADFISFERAARTLPKVGKVTVDKVRNDADMTGTTLLQAAAKQPALAGFAETMQQVQASLDNAEQAMAIILDTVGYRNVLRTKYTKESWKLEHKLESLKRFSDLIRSLAEEKGEASVHEVVERLAMGEQEKDDPQGRVVVSTIHKAKGKEWYRVYVWSVVEGYLPHKFSSKRPEEVEEERRLWYVAVTRPKDILVICLPTMVKYMGSEPKRAQPSRFLYEVGIVK